MGRAGRRLWVNSGSGCFFIHILLVPFPLPHQPAWGRGSKTQTQTPLCPHAGRDLRVVHFSHPLILPDSPTFSQLRPWPLSSDYDHSPFWPYLTSHLS